MADTKLHPPHNIELERQVLGGMMHNVEAALLVSNEVREDDFYLDAHRHIFAAIHGEMTERGGVELQLIVDRLTRQGHIDSVGGKAYVSFLVYNLTSSWAAPEHAQMVRKDADLRRVMAAADRAMRMAHEQRADPEEILAEMNAQLASILSERAGGAAMTSKEAVAETLAGLERVWQGEAFGSPWGFPRLDEMIGPMPRGGLVVVAGRTGQGKTTFLLALLRKVASERPALLFSLEMNVEEVGAKLLARETSIGTRHAASIETSTYQRERIRSVANSAFDKNKLLVDDTPNLNLERLASRARAVKIKNPELAAVAVDYLQLVEVGGNRRGHEDRVRDVAKISRGLKLLARELDLPVIALSQFSRKADDKGEKTPKLSFLRECGAIEQDASVVLALWGAGEEKTQQTNASVELHVLKSRMGPSQQVVKLSFDKTSGSFQEDQPGGYTR